MRHERFEPINLLDKTLFLALFHGQKIFRPCQESPYSLDVNGVHRILVIRPGGLGDMLLALPFFRRLKKLFPEAVVDLVCMKRNVDTARILDDELGFNRLLLLERDAFTLWRSRYDLAISLDQSKYRYIVPSLMGMIHARIKVGYDIGDRTRFCTHRVVYRHDEHEAQSSLNILKFFGPDPTVSENDLLLDGILAMRDEARPLLEKNGLVAGGFIACSFGGLNPQNKLPDRTARVLLELLKQRPGMPLAVLGGAADYAEAERLHAGIDNNVLNLCGQTTLRQTLGLLGHAALFFGYDGGPLHMAVAAGCPTVSVWGPSLFDKWAPTLSTRHVFVKRQLACQPCLNGRFPIFAGCPHGLECLNSLSADEIAGKIQERVILS
jgi:ADP-heptose:LPS heptosyltransferase